MKKNSFTNGDLIVGLKGPGIEVGCLARVKEIKDLSEERFVVKYECIRRLRVVEYYGTGKSIFPAIDIEWLDDNDIEEATGEIYDNEYIQVKLLPTSSSFFCLSSVL